MYINLRKVGHHMKTDTDKARNPVFILSATFVGLFVMWGIISPGSLSNVAGNALTWLITNFGWFYMLITAFFVLFVIVLAISPFGKMRLGRPDDRPDYSWISWIGMLFAAGIGVGFVFWGVAEPVLYYLDPPVGVEPGTTEAATAGLRYGAYHWAMHPWAIFSIVGLTLAYVQFRKGRPALVSSAFYPLIGDKTEGWIGQVIDILAVLATCTGVATTFGLSAMQITGGLSYISPIPNSPLVQIIIIIIVSVLFMVSASRGLDKGIRILSNINVWVAGLLLMFLLIVGPTLFIADNFVTTVGGYISNLIPMSLTLNPFSGNEWLGKNTIFFWAWHISWAPFMGLFIARISRGRTIREFIAGVLLIPSIIAILWFVTFGGTALHVELFGGGGLAELVTSEVELALFATLEALPMTLITSITGLFLIFIFFITSADSATYVLGMMTSRGSFEPTLGKKLVWGMLIAGTASVLLLSGGGGLDALQTASLVAALPFAIIMICMVVSILIMLSRDYKVQMRKESRSQTTNVKEVLMDDMKEEVYDDMPDKVYDEMKEKVYDEIPDKVYDDMKEKVYDEIKDDMYDEMKDEVYDEMKNEMYDEMKERVYDDMKDQVYDDMKEKVQNDLIEDIKEEIIEHLEDDPNVPLEPRDRDNKDS